MIVKRDGEEEGRVDCHSGSQKMLSVLQTKKRKQTIRMEEKRERRGGERFLKGEKSVRKSTNRKKMTC